MSLNDSSAKSSRLNPAGLRALLRQSTQAGHERLNRHVLLSGLLQPDYSLTNYRLLLLTFYQLYQSLERGLTDFATGPAAGFDYATRVKLPWLQADLHHFRIDPERLQPALAPVCVPTIASVGDFVGTLYVIEGSTLGGQMIAKCVRQNLGLSPSSGVRFYFGYGEATASMWQDFIDFAESIVDDSAQVAAAQIAAASVFELFLQQLDLAVSNEHGLPQA